MKVSQVSKLLGVSPDTIRYYSRIGIVLPARAGNGYKDYGPKEVQALRFALRAKQLGFSLTDIKALLEISRSGETPCPKVREIVQRNVESLSEAIEESLKLYRRMQNALDDWQSKPDLPPDSQTICALIEGFQDEEAGKKEVTA